ncbi:MAG: solute carrier family 26 protein [Chloroflexota bacterium]
MVDHTRGTAPTPKVARRARTSRLAQVVPSLTWMRAYQRRMFPGDLMAGIVVAIMLVPQSMAYALLAGLPAQVGLYASIVPLVIYGLLGTSRELAVGPVAMVSLLVASGLSGYAEVASAEYVQLALTLSALIATFQILLGLVRAGFLINFLSHPVLVGFTSAAAIIIGASQLRHLMGVEIPRTAHVYETLVLLWGEITNINAVTLGLGVLGIVVLVLFKRVLPGLLERLRLPQSLIVPVTRAGPLVIVLIGTLLVWRFGLDEAAGVAIVGAVPRGLPPLTTPQFDLEVWRQLLPTALAISIVGYMESIAMARSLASRNRQRVDANQELIALGAANFGAAFTGGFPVTGGLSRSVVNSEAGATSGLASMITAGLIALTVLFLTPLFFYLPNAVLAAIILVAVANLIDVKSFRETWAYSRMEGTSMLITFVGVLIFGIEIGILIGAVAALSFHLLRTSRPHMAVVGRIGESEHFRNHLRHHVQRHEQVVVVRVDESLYFANAQYLEEYLINVAADHPNMTCLVLACGAVNHIDTSALHMLENLLHELRDAKVNLCLAEVKGPVMDSLKETAFIEEIGEERIFLSVHQAMQRLTAPVQ